MYKSPINVVFSDLVSDSVKKTDEYIVACVQQVGVYIDKDDLIKALRFDREQYEKGWNDRDAEIVRCKDCRWFENDGYHTNCQIIRFCVEAEDYCSRGERREDDKRGANDSI